MHKILSFLKNSNYKPVLLKELSILKDANDRIKYNLKWKSDESWGLKLLNSINKIFYSIKPYFNFILKWSYKYDKPYLMLTPINTSSKLIEQIINNPPEIGNMIMYLLEKKRNLSDKELINSIDKKIKIKYKFNEQFEKLNDFKMNLLEEIKNIENNSNEDIKYLKQKLKSSNSNIIKIENNKNIKSSKINLKYIELGKKYNDYKPNIKSDKYNPK